MDKISFKTDSKLPSSLSKVSGKSQRDSSQVSNRWKEVNEKKNSSKEPVEEKSCGRPGVKKQACCPQENLLVDFHEEEANSSPFDLFSQMEGRRKKGAAEVAAIPKVEAGSYQTIDSFFAADDGICEEIDPLSIRSTKDGASMHLMAEISAMSSMNKGVSIAVIQSSTDGVKPKISPKTISLIEGLIQKIVDEITLLKVDGRTETTLTLKHPPLFSGAELTITEFESSKNECNIKFENLSATAHQLISMPSNLDLLKAGLKEKGYAVHIVIASTEIEKPEMVYKGYNDREGSGKREQQQRQDTGNQKKFF